MLVLENYSKDKKKGGTFHYPAPSQSASTCGTIEDRGRAACDTLPRRQQDSHSFVTCRADDSYIDPMARGSVHEVQPPFDMGDFDATLPLFFTTPDPYANLPYCGTLRYYVFTQCVENPGVIGIWYTKWQVVRSHLPNQSVKLCRNTDLHSFESYAGAIEYWVRVRGVVPFRRCV
jgi:hypothetical protein